MSNIRLRIEKKDSFYKKISGYLRMKIGEDDYQTSTEDDGGNICSWIDVINIEYKDNHHILIELYNKYSIKSDEFIAVTGFPLNKVEKCTQQYF